MAVNLTKVETYNTFDQVVEAKSVDSKCNSIGFKNTGNVDAFISGLVLAVGDALLTFDTPNLQCVDTTSYLVTFRRTPDNANYVVNGATTTVGGNVLLTVVVAIVGGVWVATATLGAAVTGNISIDLSITYKYQNGHTISYPTDTYNIPILAGATNASINVFVGKGVFAISQVNTTIANIIPNPVGGKTIVTSGATTAGTTVTVQANPQITVIRTFVKGVI